MRCLVVLAVFLGTIYGDEENVFRVSSVDSYLEAYKATRGDSVNALLDEAVKKNDREYIVTGGYPDSRPQYGPPLGPLGPSGPDYGPPNYGPPRPQYGPPNIAPIYGPPNPGPVYGPPNPAPVYGPPAPPPPVYNAPSSVQVFYGMPHAMLSFWDKLKLKLDLFTIGKILLKLVIFKKIVSFIAILCLLLFIPALKHKDESSPDNEGIMRSISHISSGENRINNISRIVLQSIESFSKNNSTVPPHSTSSRIQKVLRKLDKKITYKKLMQLYSKELLR